MIPGPLDRPRYTLPASRRIRHKPDFDALQARGRRCSNEYFALRIRPNGSDGARLGLAVSVKVAGNAVKRNRIRRLIRESFRLNQHGLPAVDLLVSARSRACGAANGELRASLQTLWSEVTRQCAT